MIFTVLRQVVLKEDVFIRLQITKLSTRSRNLNVLMDIKTPHMGKG